MNIDYWGVPIPRSDTINGPARALPVVAMGAGHAMAHVGSQVVAFTDAAGVTLTIPTDAVYARVQVNGGAAWYSTNGTLVTIATGDGFKVADQAIIELFGYDQLSKFKLRGHTAATGKIFVEYKKYFKYNQA